MATFLEMQDEVQFHLRQRASLSTFVKAKINQAVLDVMLLVKPPEFQDTFAITTSAGTPNYAIPPSPSDNILAVIGVSIDVASFNGRTRRLKHGDYREFDEMDTTRTGRPKKWFRYANEIILYNDVPDDNSGSDWALTLRTLERPTLLTAESDTFPLALEWEEPVVLRAASKMFTLLGNQDRKGVTDAMFQESIGFIVDQTKAIENSHDKDASMRQGSHQNRVARSRRG